MEILRYFDDVQSLSRTGTVLAECTRRLSSLSTSLTELERETPEAVLGACEGARFAVSEVEAVRTRTSAVREGLQAHIQSSTRVCERTRPARTRLHRLRQAQLLLSTLLHAEEASEAVRTALANEGGPKREAGAESAALGPLMRLHVLHTSVLRAAREARCSDALPSSPPVASDDADGDNAKAVEVQPTRRAVVTSGPGDQEESARVVEALALLVGRKLHALLPELRKVLGRRLTAVLSVLEWPAANVQLQQPTELRELRAAFSELLLLQHAATAAAATVDGAGVHAMRREQPTDELWALKPLIAPVLKRFTFHFEGRRETNRTDKPEWMFTHCCNLLRLHAPFLVERLQAMLRHPLHVLRKEVLDGDALAAEQEGYLRMLGVGCPHGCFGALANALCEAMATKLSRGMPTLLDHPPLFAHTLTEALACEQELRQSLGLAHGIGGVLRAFDRSAAALSLWLRLETEDSDAQLQKLVNDEANWQPPPPPPPPPAKLSSTDLPSADASADGGSERVAGEQLLAGGVEGEEHGAPPQVAVSVMQLVRGFTKRLELLSNAPAQRRLFFEVELPLLANFVTHLRTRAAATTVLAEHSVGDWAAFGALMQTLSFCARLLDEWQEAGPLADYAAASATAATAESSEAHTYLLLVGSPPPDRVFSSVLADLDRIAADLEDHAVEQLTSNFSVGTRRYLQERRELRLLPLPPPTALAIDVSSALCEPLSQLRSDLGGLQGVLPTGSARRIWQRVAVTIDSMLYEKLVSVVQCSLGGALQLAVDLKAVISSFALCSARPHTKLRRLSQSCTLLQMSAPERTRLQRALTPQADGAQGHLPSAQAVVRVEALTAASAVLSELGIYQLSVAEARDLLSRLPNEPPQHA